jgi:hypothetical protein
LPNEILHVECFLGGGKRAGKWGTAGYVNYAKNATTGATKRSFFFACNEILENSPRIENLFVLNPQ